MLVDGLLFRTVRYPTKLAKYILPILIYVLMIII